MPDVQSHRARQYAVCTYALEGTPAADGAEAIFDQALSNGLAAIVAAEWPGSEVGRGGRVLSAGDLLTVIEQRGRTADDGFIHLLREGQSEWVTLPFEEDPFPNFTSIDVRTLRDGLDKTQDIRHARHEGEDPEGVSDEHIAALRDLGNHPALFALDDEALERAEMGLAQEVAAEHDRATDYWAALGEDERARRMAINYREHYAWETADERCEVQDCPVCWQEAIVATEFDSYLDQIGIGTCIACGYQRSRAVADDEAMTIELKRMADKDD